MNKSIYQQFTIAICLLVLLTSQVNGAEKNKSQPAKVKTDAVQVQTTTTAHFENPNFKTASAADSYLKFSGKSTKVGIFTTTFWGYVKVFDIEAVVSENDFSKTKVVFKTDSIDTDVEGRNEKLLSKCLDSKTYPEVVVELLAPALRNKLDQEIPGTILIRGVAHPIQLKISTTENESEYVITGSSEFSVKETKIPDPSIAVAKLGDKIELFFNLKIKK